VEQSTPLHSKVIANRYPV